MFDSIVALLLLLHSTLLSYSFCILLCFQQCVDLQLTALKPHTAEEAFPWSPWRIEVQQVPHRRQCVEEARQVAETSGPTLVPVGMSFKMARLKMARLLSGHF